MENLNNFNQSKKKNLNKNRPDNLTYNEQKAAKTIRMLSQDVSMMYDKNACDQFFIRHNHKNCSKRGAVSSIDRKKSWKWCKEDLNESFYAKHFQHEYVENENAFLYNRNNVLCCYNQQHSPSKNEKIDYQACDTSRTQEIMQSQFLSKKSKHKLIFDKKDSEYLFDNNFPYKESEINFDNFNVPEIAKFFIVTNSSKSKGLKVPDVVNDQKYTIQTSFLENDQEKRDILEDCPMKKNLDDKSENATLDEFEDENGAQDALFLFDEEIKKVFSKINSKMPEILNSVERCQIEGLIRNVDVFVERKKRIKIRNLCYETKKNNHLVSEQLRRGAINIGLNVLSSLVPQASSKSKKIIIYNTIKYILELRLEIAKLKGR